MVKDNSDLTLFDMGDEPSEDEFQTPSRQAPLARRLAPQDLEEFVGQEHLLGPDRPLRRAIDADRLTSLILYGPPGVGKTALARIIARKTNSSFVTLNAVTSGVADVRAEIRKAKKAAQRGRRTILFLDEIHRFNRAQQDALLPSVEAGDIILIGATTANPFFAINSPLLSRSQIYELYPLTQEDMQRIVERAISHPELGIARDEIEISEEAIEHIVLLSNGDARRAINTLETSLLCAPRDASGRIEVTAEVIQGISQRKAQVYDGSGDEHYDIVSAFIKSMRGSNPDAALYWMAVMLRAGEDPRFIARRIAIAAAEDVGNADPMALVLANAAVQTLEFIGMPEGQLVLAQAVAYVSAAPKSNSSTLAIGAAMNQVESGKTIPVPNHLRDAHYPGAKRLRRGEGYKYAHDFPEHFVKQDYGIVPGTFYIPTPIGKEREIKERLEKLWEIQPEDQQ